MIASIEYLGLIDEDALELDRAALDLARLDHPSCDLSVELTLLERIADRIRAKSADLDGPAERAIWLSRVMAGEFGFDGDRKSYEDAANADLIMVLQRRRGLPIALSLLYVAMARRAGWQANVLDTPGHALMALSDARVVVLDPFRGGIEVPAERLAAPPSGIGVRLEQLAPMSNRAVLVRLLVNQSKRATEARDFARALVLMQRVTTTAPAYSPGWWERARLELAAGDRGSARLSLNSMLETTKDARIRTQILGALKAL